MAMVGGGDSRYRLSKPRTKSLTGGPGQVESKSELDASFTKEPPPIAADPTDTVKSRHAVKETFYGDGTPLRQGFDSDEEDGVEITKSVRKRFSRTNTAVSKRSSMRLSLGVSRSDIRDQSSERELSQEDCISETIKRKAQRDKMMALNKSLETTMDGINMQERIISPIRRRSFFTPGLATRNPIDMLAKPPKPSKKEQAEIDYYYNPGLSNTSPLERLASLDLANRPITPLPRATTPGDLDYGLIGKLHVTNGIASPSPSSKTVKSPKTTIGLRHSINYFESPPGYPILTATDNAFIQEVQQSEELYRDLKSNSPEPIPVTPPTKEIDLASMFGPPTVWPQAKTSYKIHNPKKRSQSQSAPRSASSVARDYTSNLDENPFNNNNPFDDNKPFDAATKPSEMEAELFDEQSLRGCTSMDTLRHTPQVLDSIEIDVDSFERQMSQMLTHVPKSSSTLNTTITDILLGNDNTSISKADSGYSSSSSTNKYRKDWGAHTADESIDVTQGRSSPDKQEQDNFSTVKQRRRPTPVTMPTSTTNNSSVFSRSIQASTDTIPTVISSKPYQNYSRPATPKPTTSRPGSPTKKLQKPRPRSQPPPSSRVAIQMHPEIDPDRIPLVPEELTRRMERRFAEMPPLHQTSPGIAHLRLKRQEMDQGPLSAPLIFPEPWAANERQREQPMNPRQSRPKLNSNRHSFMGMLPYRKSSSGLVTGNIELKSATNSHPSSPRPAQEAPHTQQPKDYFPTERPKLPRAKSMIGLSDKEASELSRMRSSARTDTIKAEGRARAIRRSSSIYTEALSAVAGSEWTDDSPDIRQISGGFYAARENTQNPRDSLYVSRRSNDPQEQVVPTMHNDPGLRQLRKSSSERKFNDRGGIPGRMPRYPEESKELPPMPSIPVSAQIKLHEAKIETLNNAKKALPPLPHQKQNSLNNIARGLSPCREVDDRLSLRRSMMHLRTVELGSSQDLSLNNEIRETEAPSRYIRMQSEPPMLPPAHWQPMLPQMDRPPTPPRKNEDYEDHVLAKSLSHNAEETYHWRPAPKEQRRSKQEQPSNSTNPGPRLATESSQAARESRSRRDTLPQSPQGLRQSTDLPRVKREPSPEMKLTTSSSVLGLRQGIERPEVIRQPSPNRKAPVMSPTHGLRQSTEWPRIRREPSPERQKKDNIPRNTPNVPTGLVAMISGRFEGGLSYNYKPGYGVTDSAGSGNGKKAMQKSAGNRAHLGIDLTDVPIFVTPRG